MAAELTMHFQRAIGQHLVKITVAHTGRRQFTLLGPMSTDGGRAVMATGSINWGSPPRIIDVDTGVVPENFGPEILQASYDMYR
jgi:hypothetical protein